MRSSKASVALEAIFRATPVAGFGADRDLAIMILDADFGFPTLRYAFETPSTVAVGAAARFVG